MQLRLDLHQQLARVSFFRLLAQSPAKFDVVVNTVSERSLQLFHRTAPKSDDITQVDDLAVKDLGVRILLDCGLITVVAHHGHGRISASVRKRLSDFNASLWVSLAGCGG